MVSRLRSQNIRTTHIPPPVQYPSSAPVPIPPPTITTYHTPYPTAFPPAPASMDDGSNSSSAKKKRKKKSVIPLASADGADFAAGTLSQAVPPFRPLTTSCLIPQKLKRWRKERHGSRSRLTPVQSLRRSQLESMDGSVGMELLLMVLAWEI